MSSSSSSEITNRTSEDPNSVIFGVLNLTFGILGTSINFFVFYLFIDGRKKLFRQNAYYWMIFLAWCDTVECLVLGVYIGLGSLAQTDFGLTISSLMVWSHWTFENALIYFDILLGADRMLTICYRATAPQLVVTNRSFIYFCMLFIPVCAGVGAVAVIYPRPVFGFVPRDYALEYLTSDQSVLLPALCYSIVSEMFSYGIQMIFTLRVCREVWLTKQMLAVYRRKDSCHYRSDENLQRQNSEGAGGGSNNVVMDGDGGFDGCFGAHLAIQIRLFIQFAAPSCVNVLLAIVWYSVRYSPLSTSAAAMGASNTARWVFTSVFRSVFYLCINRDLQKRALEYFPPWRKVSGKR